MVLRSQGQAVRGVRMPATPGASGCSAWPQTGGLSCSSPFSPGSGGQTSKVKASWGLAATPALGRPLAPEALELPAAQASPAVAALLLTLFHPALVCLHSLDHSSLCLLQAHESLDVGPTLVQDGLRSLTHSYEDPFSKKVASQAPGTRVWACFLETTFQAPSK